MKKDIQEVSSGVTKQIDLLKANFYNQETSHVKEIRRCIEKLSVTRTATVLPSDDPPNSYETRLNNLDKKNRELLNKIVNLERELQLIKKSITPKSSESVQVLTSVPPKIPLSVQPISEPDLKASQRTNQLANGQPSTSGSRNPVVSLARNGAKPIIVGTRTAGSLTAAERRQWLYLGRCNPKTSEEQILSYMKDQRTFLT